MTEKKNFKIKFILCSSSYITFPFQPFQRTTFNWPMVELTQKQE